MEHRADHTLASAFGDDVGGVGCSCSRRLRVHVMRISIMVARIMLRVLHGMYWWRHRMHMNISMHSVHIVILRIVHFGLLRIVHFFTLFHRIHSIVLVSFSIKILFFLCRKLFPSRSYQSCNGSAFSWNTSIGLFQTIVSNEKHVQRKTC